MADAPSWSNEDGPVEPGQLVTISTGDPRDGLPIAAWTCRWGVPNPYLADKGHDPLDSPILVTRAELRTHPALGRARCLVHAREGRRALYLAGVIGWLDRPEGEAGEDPERLAGFALLVDDEGEVLEIPSEEIEAWLDGWSSLAEAARCGLRLASRSSR